ncbi:MAG TPA: heme A synthase, partial [Gammaproteobacteria bacterium]|nr:heme A synthase [Gammaproteobacteria bacterium]
PMSEAQWMVEFDKYKMIPEFQAENPDINLAGFKFIYFMEWSHRQLGRLIGLAYLIPFLIFAGLKKLEPGKGFRFLSIFLLICIQGAIGWWMVSSGLAHGRVDVTQYRLATHLALAFFILGLLFWTWRDQKQGWPVSDINPKLRFRTSFLASLVFLQVIAGAFVAGTHAGRSYNTWPLMDGGFIPGGYLAMSPTWINMFENVATIQFNHRILGYLVLIVALLVALAARKLKYRRVMVPMIWLLGLVTTQIILGIVALLKHVELPFALAHQAGAIFVFLSAVALMRSARIRSF